MAAIGPGVFAAFVWGSLLAVLLVFAYQCYAFAIDGGLIRDNQI